MNPLSIHEQLAESFSEFYADPLGWVMFSFPWDSDPSIQLVKLQGEYAERFDSVYGPDKWACEFLDRLGDEIKKRGFDGTKSVPPIQFSTASGHGIGKSTLTAWLILFIMSTRPYAKGIVTANTAEQLRTKTWSELGKWHQLFVAKDWFTFTGGRGSMSFVASPKIFGEEAKSIWRTDGFTSREENSESFAGLHNAASTPFYIFDEASAIPDKIFEVREGGTTDGEPMTFDFGNPTRNSGKFFENTIGSFRHRYITRTIDSRDVAITNKSRLQQWIEDYGEDSDFVKVRVKGVFPSQGFAQFISSDDVDLASRRPLEIDDDAPLVIGVDVARFGKNETVIYPRIGNDARSFKPRRLMGLDNMQVAGEVAKVVHEFRALGKECSALFVDGTGLGSGVVDALRHMGFNPIDVNFGGNAINKTAYRRKVDEMWGEMQKAIKMSLCLPEERSDLGRELRAQLTQREYSHTPTGQVSLETKADMEERLNDFRIDVADALALTYAMPVENVFMPKSMEVPRAQTEYNPF